MSLPATDSFDRTGESPLQFPWIAPDGNADSKFILISNHLNGQGLSTIQWMYYSETYANSHKSQVTLGGSDLTAAATYAGVVTNMQATGQSGYLFGLIAGGGYKIQRMDSGTRQNLADCTGTPTVGDLLRLDSDRSAGTLTAYVNGSQVGQVTGESTYTGGAAGLFGYNGGGAFTLEDFAADNLAGTPPPTVSNAAIQIAPVGFA